MSYYERGRGFSGGSALSGAGFGGISLYERRLGRPAYVPTRAEEYLNEAVKAEARGNHGDAYAWLWTAIAEERRGG
tara:strand:- start:179 stop:406 length:228 start_codon:yes stop_codon:yes gene_type:complete